MKGPLAFHWGHALLLTSLALLMAPARGEALDAHASSGPVSLEVRIEPDAPTIGDSMTLSIEAVAEKNVEVLMPDFGEALDRFAIVDFAPIQRLDDGGRSHFEQRYTLEAPMSGPQTLPPIRIEFVDHRADHPAAPEGQDAYELLSDPISFEVESVIPDPASADLSPPMKALRRRGSHRFRPWAWALASSIALLGFAPFAWRAWQKRRSRANARTAYEIAQMELDALRLGGDPTPAEIDTFFVRLSGIVRQYLERRFAIRSPELTTERFLEVVSHSPDLNREHRALLASFLQQSDLVKFAHVFPSRETIDEAVSSADRFLQDTRDDLAPGPERERGVAS